MLQCQRMPVSASRLQVRSFMSGLGLWQQQQAPGSSPADAGDADSAGSPAEALHWAAAVGGLDHRLAMGSGFLALDCEKVRRGPGILAGGRGREGHGFMPRERTTCT